MRGALTLAHKNFVWWEMPKYSALALVCHAHLITRMNARLLFEGGSYFFEIAKSAATIRGRLLFLWDREKRGYYSRAATIRGAATIQVNTVSPRHFNYSAHAYASPIEPPTQSIHTPCLDLAPGTIKARYRGDFVLEKDPLDPPSVSAPGQCDSDGNRLCAFGC